MESSHILDETESKLQTIYNSLNPAQLKRDIEKKLKKLYRVYQEKNGSQRIDLYKSQRTSYGCILNDLTTLFGLPSHVI